MTKTEQALQLIINEGISAKDAAERVGISRAAVSKGKLHPSKTAENLKKIYSMQDELENLRAELAASQAEVERLKRRESEFVNEIETKNRKISELCAKKFARFNDGECWVYQGDGEDPLESLVCPVVISPAKLIELTAAKVEADAKQAMIDALMLEYCPDEMTKEQLETWAAHQRPVIASSCTEYEEDTDGGSRAGYECPVCRQSDCTGCDAVAISQGEEK